MSRGFALVAIALVALTLVGSGCAAARATEEPAPASNSPPPPPGAGPTTSDGAASGRSLAGLSFEGVDEAGREGVVSLDGYREGGERARLLVVRVHGGEWCGTCAWHVAHTTELLAESPRVVVLDLVVGSRDNDDADLSDAVRWRRLVDAKERVAVAADPSFSLRDVLPRRPLPLVVTVDTRTMRVIEARSNPDPGAARRLVREGLASIGQDLRGAAEIDEPLVDGRFHRNEWDLIRAMSDVGEPPVDPTNAAFGDHAAIALGEMVFADRAFSPSAAVACVTCHDPARDLGDGGRLVRGVEARRAPRIALAAWSRWQLWDGRADSLWSQALGPFENPLEFGSSRLFVVGRVASAYAAEYRAAFPGAPLPEVGALPPEGKPGDPAYDALPAQVRDDVTRAFVNVGKAVAAYEATFRVEPNAFDAYARGDRGALNDTQKLGLSVFMREGCAQCHWGPRLTDDAFHSVALAPSADPGRLRGAAELLASDFRVSGRWSDAPMRSRELRASRRAEGAFKTPALRGVAAGGPFGHAGDLGSLSAVTESYGTPPAVEHGAREPWLPTFAETSQWAITPFLETLTARPILR